MTNNRRDLIDFETVQSLFFREFGALFYSLSCIGIQNGRQWNMVDAVVFIKSTDLRWLSQFGMDVLAGSSHPDSYLLKNFNDGDLLISPDWGSTHALRIKSDDRTASVKFLRPHMSCELVNCTTNGSTSLQNPKSSKGSYVHLLVSVNSHTKRAMQHW